MARGKDETGRKKQEVVAQLNIIKEQGYLYFIDKEGYVSRTKIAHKKEDTPTASLKPKTLTPKSKK
jgi:hypothetical protein